MESSERIKRRKVKWERIMKIYSPIYCLLFIIFIVLLPVTLKKDNCDKGHEWAAHYTMCSFIGIFSLLNLSLYAVCPRTIKLTKRNILEAVFLLIGEICGQLDLYTDFCFLNIVWHIEDNETARLLGWAALILICLTTIPHFLYLIYYILKVIFGRIEKKHILLLSTYTEKHFIHFAVLETKKNKINIADRVMTSRLAMWKLVTEDVPQCCIQMLYMFKELCVVRSQGGWFLWVSISLSLICVAVVSLPSFIIAYYQRRRPTMISQLLKEQVVDMRLYLPLDKDIHNLFIDLGDNSQVRVKLLKMKFCNLKGPMLEGITSMLHRNQTITGLNIRNNVIGDEGSKYISNGIKANYTLTDLDLRHNDIHDIGLKEMFITIQFKRSFKYLYLSHNIMGQESTDALEQCIQYPFQLQILKLRNTQLSEDQTYQILNSIKNRYRKEEGHKLNRVEKEEEENAKQNEEEKEEQNEELKLKLSELDLSCNSFSSKGIEVLAELLEKDTPMDILHLEKLVLSDENALTQIFSALCQRGKPFTLLNLSENKLTDETVTQICKCIRHPFLLKRLKLRKASLSAENIGRIFEAINSTIYLELNEIDLVLNNATEDQIKEADNILALRNINILLDEKIKPRKLGSLADQAQLLLNK